MNLKFSKYQGTGNDFVIIDDRTESFDVNDVSLISRLCDRKFGIGADGLMLLRNAEGYDFRMIYFNADGKEGSMCGNGGRCLVQFAHDIGVIADEAKFIAVDGGHTAFLKEGKIHLHMIDIAVYQNVDDTYFMDTGSPHHVAFVDDVKQLDVVTEGANIRHSEQYAPAGTNVNFVELVSKNKISVRTFERGVEDETLSCGTGVTACALSTYLREGISSPVTIDVVGGELSVSFDEHNDSFTNVYLIGPATFVFKGEV